MRLILCTVVIALLSALGTSFAADVPDQRSHAAMLRENNQPVYYWKTIPVDDTAQLLTLFCRSCRRVNDLDNPDNDVPLVSVLRDTLGDNDPENDRITYVWLLSYANPGWGRKILSAVPFFYWRIGKGSETVSAHDTAPLLNLNAPVHPVISEVGRDILQWTALDPMVAPVRATTRAYRTNALDEERLHLEEAVGYLRQAPVLNDQSSLTQTELDTVIARLELRKRLLGGLVNDRRVAAIGQESNFEQERTRSRNWELLRQCAEKTGLIFESVDVAGSTNQYAIVWFPLGETPQAGGSSITPIWKILNIKNPWNDARLKHWRGPTFTRALDENGSLLPSGANGARNAELVPLGVYSLNYPKLPLLLVDFRDKLHTREHEITQRTINEVTSGVIGISHFTNWYYYVAADLFDFVHGRHGGAVDQAARLDAYSEFRSEIALDTQLDSSLRKQIQQRVASIGINPLETSPDREMQDAIARYARLQAETESGGPLITRIDKDRRSEQAAFGETKKAHFAQAFLHDASFGLYTHRVTRSAESLATVDCYRRVQYDLNFLDSLVQVGTEPEVAYDSTRIESSVVELSRLMTRVHSAEIRAHAEATLFRLRELSQNAALQGDCTAAIAGLKHNANTVRAAGASGVVASVIGPPSAP